MLAYLILDAVFDTTFWVVKKTCTLGYNSAYYLYYGWGDEESSDKASEEKVIENVKDLLEENRILKEKLKKLEENEELVTDNTNPKENNQ